MLVGERSIEHGSALVAIWVGIHKLPLGRGGGMTLRARIRHEKTHHDQILT